MPLSPGPSPQTDPRPRETSRRFDWGPRPGSQIQGNGQVVNGESEPSFEFLSPRLARLTPGTRTLEPRSPCPEPRPLATLPSQPHTEDHVTYSLPDSALAFYEPGSDLFLPGSYVNQGFVRGFLARIGPLYRDWTRSSNLRLWWEPGPQSSACPLARVPAGPRARVVFNLRARAWGVTLVRLPVDASTRGQIAIAPPSPQGGSRGQIAIAPPSPMGAAPLHLPVHGVWFGLLNVNLSAYNSLGSFRELPLLTPIAIVSDETTTGPELGRTTVGGCYPVPRSSASSRSSLPRFTVDASTQ